MREVLFSNRAALQVDLLLNYLEEIWSEKVKQDFIKKLDKATTQLAKYPESGPKSSKKNLHTFLITKQTSIYYHFDEKHIFVVSLIDNRMNNKKK